MLLLTDLITLFLTAFIRRAERWLRSVIPLFNPSCLLGCGCHYYDRLAAVTAVGQNEMVLATCAPNSVVGLESRERSYWAGAVVRNILTPLSWLRQIATTISFSTRLCLDAS